MPELVEASDEYRAVVTRPFKDADDAAVRSRRLEVEEYPGGDMTIYTPRENLYLSSEEAAALRSALGRIDADKQDTSEDADA